jgi:hypothetical protein
MTDYRNNYIKTSTKCRQPGIKLIQNLKIQTSSRYTQHHVHVQWLHRHGCRCRMISVGPRQVAGCPSHLRHRCRLCAPSQFVVTRYPGLVSLCYSKRSNHFTGSNWRHPGWRREAGVCMCCARYHQHAWYGVAETLSALICAHPTQQ